MTKILVNQSTQWLHIKLVNVFRGWKDKTWQLGLFTCCPCKLAVKTGRGSKVAVKTGRESKLAVCNNQMDSGGD